ncbi:MAG: MBL fold metallo-hydrolase [Oscillospiraceae bacterium]|nr:MBL fold metallo-hydrolase [Oscillospiraceae bacterium]
MPRKSTNINAKNKFNLIVFIAIAVIIAATFFVDWQKIYVFFGLSETVNFAAGEGVSVHFIDVGQGDSALIITPEKSVLIDSGERDYATVVFNYLIAQNIAKLDYIIATHPHSDHIGGMSEIIDYFGASYIIMPKIPDELTPTTSAFMRLLGSIDDNSVELIYAKSGAIYDLGSGAEMEIIAPIDNAEYTGLNNYSVVVKFTHAGNSFLFTGDVESEAESDIADSGADITATVLAIAHHGSNSSSTSKFLGAVGGKYAVISVGSPNQYNHPRDETLARITNRNYEILRTDVHGNIVFDSTGAGLYVYVQKGT